MFPPTNPFRSLTCQKQLHIRLLLWANGIASDDNMPKQFGSQRQKWSAIKATHIQRFFTAQTIFYQMAKYFWKNGNVPLSVYAPCKTCRYNAPAHAHAQDLPPPKASPPSAGLHNSEIFLLKCIFLLFFLCRIRIN